MNPVSKIEELLFIFPLESESNISSSKLEPVFAGSFEHPSFSTTLFLSLFKDRYDSLVKSDGSENWRTVSRWHYLADEEILGSIYQTRKLQRAVKLCSPKCYSVFELPSDDDAILERFLSVMRSVGVKNVDIYRLAPQSQILHGYIFWTGEINQDSELVLSEVLKSNSLNSQIKLITQNLVLPLQPGFEPVDGYGSWSESGTLLDHNAALDAFLRQLTNQPSDWASVLEQIRSASTLAFPKTDTAAVTFNDEEIACLSENLADIPGTAKVEQSCLGDFFESLPKATRFTEPTGPPFKQSVQGKNGISQRALENNARASPITAGSNQLKFDFTSKPNRAKKGSKRQPNLGVTSHRSSI